MGPQKVSEYQKSIKFEFIRAQMAFDEFSPLQKESTLIYPHRYQLRPTSAS
ncbi:hypothetical protein GCM10009409_39570 [Shewanella saliphila]|uniref:Uncharacterized protein n=1 Tax=Shewanella saliphila TaxID=2282698 RepID=A0ABQ2QBD4_9GAMM|nr:hypothetical protein GCM10009409_39570 [Shewanella saliphila]